MNMKKTIVVTSLLVASVVLLAQSSFAAKLCSSEDAVKDIFGSVAGLETKKVELSQTEKDAVKAKVANKDVLIVSKYTLFTSKDKAAVEISQTGKWGDIKFVVGLDAKTAKVIGVVVTDSSEKRGKPITESKYLDQFKGKGPADAITIDKDINGISGATVSSKAAAHAVKAAIAVYETVVLKK